MVSTFEISESTRKAVTYIGQLGGAHSLVINQSIYTLIRDFISTEITIANANRSGVLANMTIEEFEKAKKTEQGSMVIKVSKHENMRISEKVLVPEHETSAKTNDKDSLPESLKKERLSWKEEEVAALKEFFADDIRNKSITLEAVRDKISEHPTLQHLEAKRVCDRVRSEWRFKDPKHDEREDKSSNPSCKPPEQTENLSEKMSRFFERSAHKSTSSSSDVVLPSNPSYLSRNIFSGEKRKFRLNVCGVMVRGGVISKPYIKELLEKENEGKELLCKFTINQLVNRLKYERRLNNRQSRS